jgi:betaine lipid synthase
MIGNCSPPTALRALKENGVVPPLEISQSVICLDEEIPAAAMVVDVKPPLSSFHYQVEKVCFSNATLVSARPIVYRMNE